VSEEYNSYLSRSPCQFRLVWLSISSLSWTRNFRKSYSKRRWC